MAIKEVVLGLSDLELISTNNKSGATSANINYQHTCTKAGKALVLLQHTCNSYNLTSSTFSVTRNGEKQSNTPLFIFNSGNSASCGYYLFYCNTGDVIDISVSVRRDNAQNIACGYALYA